MTQSTLTSSRSKKRTTTRIVIFALILATVTFSGWTALKFFRVSSFPGIVREGIQLGLSNLQIEVALVGLTGLLVSISVQRKKRSRKLKVGPLKMTPMTFGTQKNVHPLMMTPRPARDSNFVIRKTHTRGRISRNRMGERLPPTYVTGRETQPTTSTGEE